MVEAATRLVHEEGVDALSIQRVADRADYTAGALYRYFPSKDALLAAVVAGLLRRLAVDLEAAEGSTPLARLAAQARVYRAFAQDDPHAFALVSAMAADPRILVADPASVASIFQEVVATLSPVAATLEAAVAEGELEPGPPGDRALALFAALQGALQLRKQEPRAPGVVDAQRIFALTLRGLLRGFGAPPAAMERALGR